MEFELKSRIEEAVYKEQVVPVYQGNPLIEALPPILSPEEAYHSLKCTPELNPIELTLPPYLRYHCIDAVMKNLFQPLSYNLKIERIISQLLRNGYLNRNPCDPDVSRIKTQILHEENIIESPCHVGKLCSASGFAIVGISGIGKSHGLKQVLEKYPPVIRHRKYKGANLPGDQIVWLVIDCPSDGARGSLCLSIFKEVDNALQTTENSKWAETRRNIDTMLDKIARIALLHNLGVLVIEEIQCLLENRAGLQATLNFLLTLENKIGVPIILQGTMKATEFLTKELRQARRCTGEGDFVLKKLNFDVNGDWGNFMNCLFNYQWFEEKTVLTPELHEAFYDQSQGIPDFAKKIYRFCQETLIFRKEHIITPTLIKELGPQRLQFVQEIISDLRSGSPARLVKYDDILPAWERDAFYQQRIKNPPSIDATSIFNRSTSSPLEHISQWLIQAGVQQHIAFVATQEVLADTKLKSINAQMKKAFLISQDMLSKKRIKSNISKSNPGGSGISPANVTNYDMLMSEGIIPPETSG